MRDPRDRKGTFALVALTAIVAFVVGGFLMWVGGS